MRRVIFLENYSIASAPFVLWVKVWSKTSNLYKTFHQQSIIKIIKNYRKYDKDISDDGDQDEKNNCCLDMSIWTLSVVFFSMPHFVVFVDFFNFTLFPRPKTKTFLKIMVDYQLGPGVSPPLRLLPPLDGGKEDSVFRVEFTDLVSWRMKNVWLCYI